MLVAVGEWDDFDNESVRRALPDRLRQRAARIGVGAFVIPVWCRSCLARVWVWLGMRTGQLCGDCILLSLQGLHVFELVDLGGTSWDDVCVRCGQTRTWKGPETPCRPTQSKE